MQFKLPCGQVHGGNRRKAAFDVPSRVLRAGSRWVREIRIGICLPDHELPIWGVAVVKGNQVQLQCSTHALQRVVIRIGLIQIGDLFFSRKAVVHALRGVDFPMA